MYVPDVRVNPPTWGIVVFVQVPEGSPRWAIIMIVHDLHNCACNWFLNKSQKCPSTQSFVQVQRAELQKTSRPFPVVCVVLFFGPPLFPVHALISSSSVLSCTNHHKLWSPSQYTEED